MRKLFFSLLLLVATSLSGQIAISNLPTFNSVSDSAWVPAVIGSTTYKIRGAKLKATSTLQEVLNAGSTFSKSNYIDAFAKTLRLYNADSIVLQGNNVYLNAINGIYASSLQLGGTSDSVMVYNAATKKLGYKSIGSFNLLKPSDTADFATRTWSNNTHPRFDGTYNNPTWLNTLHTDKLINYSATPFQALVSDGNGFFVPYTIPYVSTYDTAAMLGAYKHWNAGYLKTADTANATRTGSLSRHDWSVFNNKYNLPSLTSGSVLFSNGTTIAQDNANLFWDNINKRLGINITPIDRVHIGGNKINSQLAPEFTGLVVSDLNSATTGVGGGIVFRGNHNGTTFSTTTGVIQTFKENSTPGDISFAMGFHTRLNGTSQWPERVRITSDGNFLVNTSTNSGFRADINGTARIVGKITQPTTANSPMGTATLVSGTVTVSNTLATTGCYIAVRYRTGTAPSTTTSTLVVTTVTNNTSFVVTAYQAGTVTTNTSDNNTIEYTISN